MKTYLKASGVLAAVLIGFGGALVSGAAISDANATVRLDGMRKMCTKHGGRFERSWRYNDQGVKWGEVLSCSTRWGSITCQKNVCRTTRRVGSGDANGGARQFPASPAAIAEALVALARN